MNKNQLKIVEKLMKVTAKQAIDFQYQSINKY